MAKEPFTVKIDPESELGRALDDAAEGAVVLDRAGVRYRLTREDAAAGPTDTARVRAILAATAGSWADLDIDRVTREVYAARQAGSRPADRP